MIEKITSAGSWGRSGLARWAPIPLRLIVGYGFMEHGCAKMARGADSFAAILHALGVPAPHLMTWVSILTELLGGLAVLVGAFLTLASVPMAILLLVAIFTVHLPNGFSSVKLFALTGEARAPSFLILFFKNQEKEMKYSHPKDMARICCGGQHVQWLDDHFAQQTSK